MLHLLRQIVRTGLLTEPAPAATDDPELHALGCHLQQLANCHFHGSIAIRQVDAGSCNGCELEIHALNNAYYNLERYGAHFVASPRHADVLLVTGPVSRHMEEALRRVHRVTPSPKLVLAVGDCGADGGEFGCSYASCGGVSRIIPVDGVVRGCPPTPIDLLRALVVVLETTR